MALGGPPFVALVSLSNKGEIQYTGVDARWSRAYFSHLVVKKGPQVKIWLAMRPIGAADLTVVYAARPNPYFSLDVKIKIYCRKVIM